MKYIIQDDFCNTLQYNGQFQFTYYGEFLGVPMEFDSEDEAFDYMAEHFPNEELWVESMKEVS